MKYRLNDKKKSTDVCAFFSKRFGSRKYLRRNGAPKEIGTVAVQNVTDTRIIFHLITKEKALDKTDYFNIWRSQKHLRAILNSENDPRALALPKIACGRDQKDWRIMKFMISYIFRPS